MTKYDTETEAESYEAAHLARIALDAAMEAVDHYQRRHGVCDAPFRCTLHVGNGGEADREVSGPGEHPGLAASLSEILDRSVPDGVEKHDDGWIRHDGGECPVHPKDMVEGKSCHPVPASWVAWSVFGSYYRPLRDEDGVPYCSAEGLEDWAEYVATDEYGEVWQYSIRPTTKHATQWDAYTRSKRRAPDRFANTRAHWMQTLRRVYRREDA